LNLRKRNLESLLNRLQYFLIGLTADERDRETLGSETTGTTHTMEVGVGVTGKIVVNGQVNPLNIDTTAKNIGGDTDTLLEVLERLVALDTVSSLELKRPQYEACTYRSSWLTPE
jgi:hypothetical protein